MGNQHTSDGIQGGFIELVHEHLVQLVMFRSVVYSFVGVVVVRQTLVSHRLGQQVILVEVRVRDTEKQNDKDIKKISESKSQQ